MEVLCGRDWAAGVEGRGSGRRRSDVIRPDEDAMKDEVWFIVGYAGRRDVGDEDGGRGGWRKRKYFEDAKEQEESKRKRGRVGRKDNGKELGVSKCPSVQVQVPSCQGVRRREGTLVPRRGRYSTRQDAEPNEMGRPETEAN